MLLGKKLRVKVRRGLQGGDLDLLKKKEQSQRDAGRAR